MKTLCIWCNAEYELIRSVEDDHLAQCPVFQGLPVAETVDGKEFIAVPDFPQILVERPKSN